ncbi:Receptor kinase-like protein Xa21 [Vitis vinifera]|uniref:Receptor kinase-like protein Xa21 n=1 Tax=Vitis vinifera TaxID=29760 RepID=A0A438GYR8_VITVI|nr:Receptor kinase-like protein Xa21 [Vitis vinifera]
MHRMIPHQELLYATGYFGEDNLIGKGSLGMVYKGVLSDGLIVVMKVFNLELQRAFKSFEVECEVMWNIRHQNLTKIISSCSNLDFKALVLEYMPNGSLEKWLYSHNYYLDFVQRLKIIIDVASGLEYLHHDYSNPVVHCDLMGNEFMKRTKTLGTVGYMALDEMFMEELTLKSWVESSTNNIMEVIDANLLTEEDESFSLKQACFSSIMTLALDCTAEPPEKRINVKDVVTLRSLTALTGVTAAACCCTSEAVALLKLYRLNAFAPLSWTAPCASGVFSPLVEPLCRCPCLPSMTHFFPRRWLPTNFFLLEYTLDRDTWTALYANGVLSPVECGIRHRDNPLFTAPGWTRGWLFCPSGKNCTAAVPSGPAQPTSPKELETVAAALVIIHAFSDVQEISNFMFGHAENGT